MEILWEFPFTESEFTPENGNTQVVWKWDLGDKHFVSYYLDASEISCACHYNAAAQLLQKAKENKEKK